MKAQMIERFGSPIVFTLTEIEKPKVTAGHVLLKVIASSVNQIDCKIRSGKVPDIAPDFPAILHGDVVGIVDTLGENVTGFQSGDEVYACGGGLKGTSGALAEYMLVDAQSLAIRPKKLSALASAALPLVGITAWEALFLKAKLQAGQKILIHGGVGGVGHIAVQLAKWAKAKVYATVTTENDFLLAKSFGANEVINAKAESVASYVERLTANRGFDIVFDTVGGPNLDLSFQAAAYNGVVVTTAARSTHDLSPMHAKGLSLHVVFMLNPLLTGEGREQHGKILQEITRLADAGLLKPLLDPKIFGFSEVAAAHAYLESGQAKGKVVLRQDFV